ncbi:MAG: hypothetical protein JNJ61_23650 [Anaerolineae bacterium]|nr:hypothetical protein [Anaerolineae bacterium]
MSISRSSVVFIALVLVLIAIPLVPALSQDVTPTSAPTKTPTTVPATSTAVPIATPHTLLPRAFTQEDLSVLTGNIQRPNGLFWYDGKLYTSCTGDWTLYEIDVETGDTVAYIFGVKNAHTLLAATENDELNLWIPDFLNNNFVNIRRGVTAVIASNLNGPWGSAFVNEDTFLVTNLAGNNLIRIQRDGETQELLSALRSPTGIATAGEYVYIANTGSARRAIEWYESAQLLGTSEALDSSELSRDHALVSGLQNVTNIVMAADGYLYFSYALGTRGVVGRVNPDVCREQGGCSNDQVEIVLYTELAAPLAGLTISPDMRLYIHSIFSPDIYWVQIETTTS